MSLLRTNLLHAVKLRKATVNCWLEWINLTRILLTALSKKPEILQYSGLHADSNVNGNGLFNSYVICFKPWVMKFNGQVRSPLTWEIRKRQTRIWTSFSESWPTRRIKCNKQSVFPCGRESPVATAAGMCVLRSETGVGSSGVITYRAAFQRSQCTPPEWRTL
jgi:hypothetical protein